MIYLLISIVNGINGGFIGMIIMGKHWDIWMYPLVMTFPVCELEAVAQSKVREFSHEKHGDVPVRYANVYERVRRCCVE